MFHEDILYSKYIKTSLVICIAKNFIWAILKAI